MAVVPLTCKVSFPREPAAIVIQPGRAGNTTRGCYIYPADQLTAEFREWAKATLVGCYHMWIDFNLAMLHYSAANDEGGNIPDHFFVSFEHETDALIFKMRWK